MANSRGLHDWEIRVARTVFADSIEYWRVRIHEGSVWANVADDWARRLRGIGSRPKDQHNAIALGFHCFFPVRLAHPLEQPGEMPHTSMAWLLHELTHVWQFQIIGWHYLLLALVAHLREGAQVYEFGGEVGLRQCRRQGRKLQSFNLEQQAAIVQSAYHLATGSRSDCIWREYLADVR